jgi:hypothetical protein
MSNFLIIYPKPTAGKGLYAARSGRLAVPAFAVYYRAAVRAQYVLITY